MAKLQIIDASGNKVREMNSEIFDGQIRWDLVQKIAETEKVKQPYAPYLWAGMDSSASGNVKHNRHVWKTDRGKGLSRYPKKRMSDKGANFVWVAAIIPGVRGGRRAFPPKIIRKELKINKQEQILGLKSALAMVASATEVKKKYARLNDVDLKVKLPLVIDSKILNMKSKQFFEMIKKVFGEDVSEVAIQEKKIRAGRGKMRNRPYKRNAGLLLVIGNKEERKISGIEVVKVQDLRLLDIAGNGARLTMFTEQSIKDLENRINGKSQVENKK
ncbi:MAG: 50S ribosomal protein L4 [Nanoarchaeota archaeon]